MVVYLEGKFFSDGSGMMMKAILIFSLTTILVYGSSIKAPACVAPGAKVVFGFSNDSPKKGDWIGLFPAGTVGSQVTDPRDQNWIWTCGSKTCTTSPAGGFANITTPNLSGAAKWIAVLARFEGGTGPFELIVKSATMLVSTNCAGTKPTPSAPTKRPSSTVKPSMKPITSNVNVVTDKTAYNLGENIAVTFSIPNVIAGDWVGIFDAATPVAQQQTAHFWLWAGCDRQGLLSGCESRTSGTLVFRGSKTISWKSNWPLGPGRYVAAILRNADSAPWAALDISPVFQIRQPAISNDLIKLARADIAQLIKADIALAAKFLRLGFHDSVGGADGCVDLSDIHNKGLDVPINALAPIVEKYKGSLSRADSWALAAQVASQVSQSSKSNFKVNFDFTEFGRIDCEKQQSVCRNEAGISHGCSATRGPHREIPGSNTNTHDLFAFFKTNYGFNQRETVAIMGAHTIGVLTRKNSGVDGPDGWVLENRILDNGYYVELIGGNGPNEPVRSLKQRAPNWLRHFESNSDLPEFDDLNIWHGLPEGEKGRVIVMLNADIAIVRDLNDSNMNPKTGEVSCKFIDNTGKDSSCPHVEGALQEAARYRFSNRFWLIDFEDALRKLLNAGYAISNNCIDGLCKLEKL